MEPNLSISSSEPVFRLRYLIKNILKAAAFTVILIFFLCLLEALLQSNDSVVVKKRALTGQPKNSVDIMFIGNSHAYCTFDPEVIQPLTGKRVLNAGIPDQKIDLAYYTLPALLKGQQPETIVLEAFTFGRSNSSYKGYVANIDSLDLGITKLQACFSIFPDKLEALRSCFRLYHCHNNWKKSDIIMKNLKYLTGRMPPNKEFTNGFYTIKSKMSEKVIQQYKTSTKSTFTPVIDDYSIGYFKRIAQLCKSRGIRLVVAMAPFNSIYLEKVDYKNTVYARMFKVCADEDVDYIDFNMLYDDIGFTFDDFENAFHDAQHTNLWGAEKASTYMADYLNRLAS